MMGLDRFDWVDRIDQATQLTTVVACRSINYSFISGGRVVVQGFSGCSAVSDALIYENDKFYIGFPCRKLSPGALVPGRFKHPKAVGDFLAICMYPDFLAPLLAETLVWRISDSICI